MKNNTTSCGKSHMGTNQRASPECTIRGHGRLEARKAGLKPLKLAKQICARPDQGKSNMDKQGFQMPIHDKETSAFLHEPSLARLITIEPNDTVNPDQDIKPMFKYVIPMSWKDQCINETMAVRLNYYAPPAHPLQRLHTHACTSLTHTNYMVTWTFHRPLHAYCKDTPTKQVMEARKAS